MSRQPSIRIQCIVNGTRQALEIDPSLRLIDILREELHLTGTKEGCGKGECGACTVIMDGRTVDSCLVMGYQVHGSAIWTIEGMSRLWHEQSGSPPQSQREETDSGNNDLHPLQRAFVDCGSSQCGICIPGMIMSAADLLIRNPDPSHDDIRQGLAGNLCRCTGYIKIFDAVKHAARKMRPALKRLKPELRADRAPLLLPENRGRMHGAGNDRISASLQDALKILSRNGRDHFQQLAGGTDALVRAKEGIGSAEQMFDIFKIRELRGIRELKGKRGHFSQNGVQVEGEIWMGSATTFTEVLESSLLKKYAPALVEACAVIGGPQIRNRGTLGGNFANASPAADSVPALMSMDAILEIASLKKRREVPAERFFLGPGKTVLKRDELIVGIRIPKYRNVVGIYLRLGQRQAQAISKVDVALTAVLNAPKRKARSQPLRPIQYLGICYGSVAPTVFRATQTEMILLHSPLNRETLQRAKEAIKKEVRPIDDIRSSAEYRREMSAVLLERALQKIGLVVE